MKRRFISIALTLVIISAVRGQDREPARPRASRQGAAALQGLSAEERAAIRDRWQSMSEEERKKFRAQIRERLTAGARAPGFEAQLKAVDEQINQIKADQKQYMDELKEIRDLALKENAKETARRIEKLIAGRQRTFRQRLQALEQRRQRLERIQKGRSDKRPDAPEVRRRKAPDFTLSSFDGKKVALADYKGKIVVLEWINLGCPFSMYHYKTKPTMVDLAARYKAKNVQWLAVNSTNFTKPDENTGFSRQRKLPFPILDDRSGRVGRAYRAETTPHVFVIDTNGMIAYEGAIDNSPNGKTPAGQELVNYVDNALADLTGGRAVRIPKTKPYGCSVKYAK
ncbi:MAG: redoxin domain-containing protein [Phycisphaerales bacterium]|nr:MAG: redoxin domain-containing protein [Phycisphaerales bacterium]